MTKVFLKLVDVKRSDEFSKRKACFACKTSIQRSILFDFFRDNPTSISEKMKEQEYNFFVSRNLVKRS